MLKLIKWLVYLILATVIAGAVYVYAMRSADGPSGLVAGGAFTTGNLQEGSEPDWSFLRDRGEVEFQLVEPPRSRTTWIVEHEGRIYIPCGYMQTTWGRIWKQWPIEAEKDGRAILRVDGKLYERRLVRIKEGDQLPFLMGELARKYFVSDEKPVLSPEEKEAAIAGALEQVGSDGLWVFELAPRA